MNREDFIDNIRKQYADEIHEAYLECEHEAGIVDYGKLKTSLVKLMRAAKVEGLVQKEFLDLVYSTLPGEATKAINFDEYKAAA